MSLILDALRKIELERKAKRQGGIDLRPDVLSYRGTPQKTSSAGRIFIVAGALLLITGVVAAVFLRNEKSPPVSKAAAPDPVRTTAPEMPPLLPTPPLPTQLPTAATKADIVRPAPVRPALREQDDEAVGRGDENIKVSGIAWQEERALRRAVVNGALVAEGAEVLGARILEIKENSVRFSRGGQRFEVQYPSTTGR
jgi:general secretion pathway protein B